MKRSSTTRYSTAPILPSLLSPGPSACVDPVRQVHPTSPLVRGAVPFDGVHVGMDPCQTSPSAQRVDDARRAHTRGYFREVVEDFAFVLEVGVDAVEVVPNEGVLVVSHLRQEILAQVVGFGPTAERAFNPAYESFDAVVVAL